MNADEKDVSTEEGFSSSHQRLSVFICGEFLFKKDSARRFQDEYMK
jgi:hypothetical protein